MDYPNDEDSPLTTMINKFEEKLNQTHKENKEFLGEMRKTMNELNSKETLMPRPQTFITRGTLFYAFTDGSGLADSEGKVRYGLGGFFGHSNTANFSLRASPQVSSMMGCELEAVAKALTSATDHSIRNLAIILDNKGAKDLTEALFQGRMPEASLLADLISTDTFMQSQVRSISLSMRNFDTLHVEWIKSHQSGRVTWKVRGNDSADLLARQGAIKIDIDQDFHPDDYEDEEDSDSEEDADGGIALRRDVIQLLNEVSNPTDS